MIVWWWLYSSCIVFDDHAAADDDENENKCQVKKTSWVVLYLSTLFHFFPSSLLQSYLLCWCHNNNISNGSRIITWGWCDDCLDLHYPFDVLVLNYYTLLLLCKSKRWKDASATSWCWVYTAALHCLCEEVSLKLYICHTSRKDHLGSN